MAAPKVSEFRWRFSVDVERAARGLDEMRAHLSDYSPVWPALAKRLGRELAQNVLRGVGKRPVRLSPAYAKRKQREGYSKTPMVRTGTMLAELREGKILDSDKLSMAQGLEGEQAVIAAALNFGTPSAKSKIPARPFFDWTPPMERAVEKALESHIDEGIARFDRGGGPGAGFGGATAFGRAA